MNPRCETPLGSDPGAGHRPHAAEISLSARFLYWSCVWVRRQDEDRVTPWKVCVWVLAFCAAQEARESAPTSFHTHASLCFLALVFSLPALIRPRPPPMHKSDGTRVERAHDAAAPLLFLVLLSLPSLQPAPVRRPIPESDGTRGTRVERAHAAAPLLFQISRRPIPQPPQ